jgi:hypothetical protein
MEMDLREIGFKGVVWTDLAQDRAQWLAFVSMVLSLRVESVEFLNQQSKLLSLLITVKNRVVHVLMPWLFCHEGLYQCLPNCAS